MESWRNKSCEDAKTASTSYEMKKNPIAVSSSTTMASFKDYLAEIMVSKEEFEGMPAKIKANYRINGYNDWLKLKNSQTAPGTVSVAPDGT